MQQRVAESAVGAGPMATLTELRDVEGPNGSRSRVEPWMHLRLRWADPGSRSLLLQAFAISGILVSYGLTLLLSPPPAFGALAALKALAVVLLLLATVVAPVSVRYRAMALWCIVVSAMCSTAWVLVESTDLFGPTTYGMLDAAELAAYGTWVTAYLLLRMRHPLTILVVITTYCIVVIALLLRVMPSIREKLEGSTPVMHESDVVSDEVVLRSTLLVVGFGLVALAWWIDGWFRPMLPVRFHEHLIAEGSDSDPAVRDRIRRAWIMIACMLDPVAIVMLHRAGADARRSGLTAHDEFMLRCGIGVAYGRLVIVLLLCAALIVLLVDPHWRH